MSTPSELLTCGRAFLEAIMQKHGFTWGSEQSGRGSGGNYASGEYRRGDRKLELHFRWSLGLVTYHVGRFQLEHSSYMRVLLGRGGKNQYPGFSEDPLNGFRGLAHDLEAYCDVFFCGTEAEFQEIVEKATALESRSGFDQLMD